MPTANSSKFASARPTSQSSLRYEVRYERSFVLDLKRLDNAGFQQVKPFVFEDFYKISQLHDLPEFRQIGSSEIFYRFRLGHYLISLEVIGQIIKFLRVLPEPMSSEAGLDDQAKF
jgi:mRNA-degrading endonuclease RelE of RelBE toxin-antitoxin system